MLKRKNRSLEELDRTLLNENNLPKYFWVDAVNTACYVLNKILRRPILKKTPSELFNGRKPNVSQLKAFCCECFNLNHGKENLGKFNSKADDGIFLGYSTHSHVYRVCNKRNMKIEESMRMLFDEFNQKMQENARAGAGGDDSLKSRSK